MNITRLMLIKAVAIVSIALLYPTLFSQDSNQAVSLNLEKPELIGLTQIANQTTAIVSFNGRCQLLTSVGEAVGPFRLVLINVASQYVDFEQDGEVLRIFLSKSEIIASRVENGEAESIPSDGLADSREVDRVVSLVARNLTPVGMGEMVVSQASMLQVAEARIDHLLARGDLTNEEKNLQLERMMNGKEQMLIIGPHGISDEEAKALKVDSKRAEKLNFMVKLGRRAQHDKILTGGRTVHMDDDF